MHAKDTSHLSKTYQASHVTDQLTRSDIIHLYQKATRKIHNSNTLLADDVCLKYTRLSRLRNLVRIDCFIPLSTVVCNRFFLSYLPYPLLSLKAI